MSRTILLETTPTQQRNIWTTSPVTVPSDAVGNFTFTADIPASDYNTANNKFWMQLFRLDAGTWKFVAGDSPDTPWTGGGRTDPELGTDYRPHISMNAEYVRRQQFRAEFNIPIQMRVGVLVELGDPPGQLR